MAGSVKTEDGDKREAALRFLSRPRELDKAIRRKKEQIDGLRSSLTSISVSYSDMPKGGSGPGSRIEDGIVGLMGLEEEVARLEKEKAEVVKEISGKIGSLENEDQKVILMQLYILYLSWEEVAARTEKSIWTISKLRNDALVELGKERQ